MQMSLSALRGMRASRPLLIDEDLNEAVGGCSASCKNSCGTSCTGTCEKTDDDDTKEN